MKPFISIKRVYKIKSYDILWKSLGNMPWLRGLKASSGITGPLKRFSYIALGRVSAYRVQVLFIFSKWCIKIVRKQGIPGLAKHLKACVVLLMQYLAGPKHKSSQELGVSVARTHSGIPRVIPVNDRKLIRQGDRVIIRFWLSLFQLYRVLDWEGVLKLKTIIDPGPTFSDNQVDYWKKGASYFLDISPFQGTVKAEKLLAKPIAINTSSPSTKYGTTSVFSSITDAGKWQMEQNTALWATFIEYAVATGNQWILRSISLIDNSRRGRPLSTSLGKLGLKPEPGKVRVFAMVDYWTQVLLKPLHDAIFRRLAKIPQDGTHNQDKPIKALIDVIRRKGIKRVFSYDLSAATDRLPLKIQEILLNEFIINKRGEKVGTLWAKLLADRPFRLGDYKGKTDVDVLPKEVRYAAGQPMGALSSWAMLALTHHMVVQLAAFRVGYRGWFEEYAILGDDVVIANAKVARAYYGIMVDELKVSIGLAKSLVSWNGSFEFAKRFVWKGEFVNPISLKEFDVASHSLPALGELVRRVSSFQALRPAAILGACGFGFRVRGALENPFHKISRRPRWLLTFLSIPGTPVMGKSTWMDWVGMESLSKSIPLPHDRIRLFLETDFVMPLRKRFLMMLGELGESLRYDVMHSQFGTSFAESDRGLLLENWLEEIVKKLSSEPQFKEVDSAFRPFLDSLRGWGDKEAFKNVEDVFKMYLELEAKVSALSIEFVHPWQTEQDDFKAPFANSTFYRRVWNKFKGVRGEIRSSLGIRGPNVLV